MTMVKFTLDPDNPPDMSRDGAKRLDAIAEVDINTDDIAELDAAFWSGAQVVANRPASVVSLRLDDETVSYFKGDRPDEYAKRMAAVLTAYARAKRAS